MNKTLWHSLFILVSGTALILLGHGCSDVSTRTMIDSRFDASASVDSVKAISGRFFLLFPNDTARFEGIRQCTTYTNNELKEISADSIFLTTATDTPVRMDIGDSSPTVYPNHYFFTIGTTSPETFRITRYFEIQDSATIQKAYTAESGNLIIPDVSSVVPYTLITGSSWQIGPVFPISYYARNLPETPSGFAFVEEGIPILETTEGDLYLTGVVFSTYYSYCASPGDNKQTQYSSMTVHTRYMSFRDRGFMEMDAMVQMIREGHDGELLRRNEHIHLDRWKTNPPVYTD